MHQRHNECNGYNPCLRRQRHANRPWFAGLSVRIDERLIEHKFSPSPQLLFFRIDRSARMSSVRVLVDGIDSAILADVPEV
jgi:hypothetical protein